MDLTRKTATRDGWSDVESEYFVERYNLLKHEVGKDKYFKNRKVFFQWIAQEMETNLQSTKNERQLTSRFYTLTRKTNTKFPTTTDKMTQGTVVDMNKATVVDINGVEIFHYDRNETIDADAGGMDGIGMDGTTEMDGTGMGGTTTIDGITEMDGAEMYGAETDGAETDGAEMGGTEMDGTGIDDIVVAGDDDGWDAETNATGMITGMDATQRNLAEFGRTETAADSATTRYNEHNKQISFARLGEPSRPNASIGIATIYNAAQNSEFTEHNSRCGLTSSAPTLRITGAFSLDKCTNSLMSSRLSSRSSLATSSNNALSSAIFFDRPSTSHAAATPERSSSDLLRNLSIAGVGKKAKVRFTDGETKWLLDQYYVYMNEIGPMKLFRTKNNMWQTMASEMNFIFESMRTGEELSKRVAEVIELKKTAVSRNRTSGASREEVEFEDELEKISAVDDSIEPEVMRDVNSVKFKKNSHKNDSSCNGKRPVKIPRWDKPNKKAILSTLSETMLGMEKRKAVREAAKEERRNQSHKALVELLHSLKKPDN